MRLTKILLPILFLASLLVGCTGDITPPAALLEDATRTAQEGAQRVLEAGKEAGERVQAAASEAAERAGNIRDGVVKIAEGKELVKRGIAGE